MLKITSRNEKLNRRMARKETTRFLYKLFYCFFVSPLVPQTWHFHKFNNVNNYGSFQAPGKNHESNGFAIILKRKNHFQLTRYFLNWQSQLLLNSSFTKTRTICFLTGRSRSIYRHFRLSRLKLREYAAIGLFTGLAKASW